MDGRHHPVERGMPGDPLLDRGHFGSPAGYLPIWAGARTYHRRGAKAEDIVTRDGRFVSPSVHARFKPFEQIVKSRVIQHAVDHVTVKLVPSGGVRPGAPAPPRRWGYGCVWARSCVSPSRWTGR